MFHVMSRQQPNKQEGSSTSNQCAVIGPYVEERQAHIVLDSRHESEGLQLLDNDRDSVISEDNSPQISPHFSPRLSPEPRRSYRSEPLFINNTHTILINEIPAHSLRRNSYVKVLTVVMHDLIDILIK